MSQAIGTRSRLVKGQSCLAASRQISNRIVAPPATRHPPTPTVPNTGTTFFIRMKLLAQSTQTSRNNTWCMTIEPDQCIVSMATESYTQSVPAHEMDGLQIRPTSLGCDNFSGHGLNRPDWGTLRLAPGTRQPIFARENCQHPVTSRGLTGVSVFLRRRKIWSVRVVDAAR